MVENHGFSRDKAILIPSSSTLTQYSGFVDVGSFQYQVMLSNVEWNDSKPFANAEFQAESALAALLAPYLSILQNRLHESTSMEMFLKELSNLLEGIGRSLPKQLMCPASYYQRLVDEIDQIGWQHLINVNETFDRIELDVKDGSQRHHSLQIQFPVSYPASAPECAVDLPNGVFELLDWTSKCTLSDVLSQFKHALTKYQPFWLVMDDFDTMTWVLEPDQPNRSAKERRIAINQHCSIHVEIDPLKPYRICEMRFFGSETMIRPLRQALNARLATWNDTVSPRVNLQKILQIEFPSPQKTDKVEFTVECGICYTYRLMTEDGPSNVPDRVCDNQKCSQPYHMTCLLEWLRSLPNSHQTFQTLVGTCPYCQETITAKCQGN